MKRAIAAVALVGTLVVPGVVRADNGDVALGLGAFAVFNQILSGTGVFGGGRTVVVERPVVVERRVIVERPVVVPPPPPVAYAPPPPVVYAPPPPVVYQPAPVVVCRRAPAVVYGPAYGRPDPHPHRAAWCPPGLARQGRCAEYPVHYGR